MEKILWGTWYYDGMKVGLLLSLNEISPLILWIINQILGLLYGRIKIINKKN